MDEAELLAGLRRGDDAAYEQLVRSYGGRVLAVTRRILGDDDDARDAARARESRRSVESIFRKLYHSGRETARSAMAHAAQRIERHK
jgi:DNA-directed RNA polymerase specialized sigma24 family protein